MVHRTITALAAAAAALALAPSAPAGGLPQQGGPDIIVADLPSIARWGTVGDVTGYSIATTSCNVGDEVLPFDRFTSSHPVITMDLFRLKDGRLEQIGLSWVKHAFGAAVQNLCDVCINPGDSQLLGIGCSDPYSASTNGNQGGFGGGTFGGLGPRSEIDPFTAAFPFPYTTQGTTGNAIFKRLQVRNDDLDPALNDGAVYFAESQYHSPEDAAAGNQNNNASYREVTVGSFVGGGWNLAPVGPTAIGKPAILAWSDRDPAVAVRVVDVPGEGRFYLSHKVTDNGDGTWRYEYAMYNLTSRRAARALSIPLPPGVTVANVGFHDVHHHSGEGFGTADWTVETGSGAVTWSTSTFAQSPSANALRWGTMYNFWFDADVPPAEASATIGLFRPDDVNEVAALTEGPSDPCIADCGDPDGLVDIRDLLGLLAEWGGPGACDLDGSGTTDLVDLLALLAGWGACPSS